MIEFYNLIKTDYDAPLSEAGDYTEKYERISKLVSNQLAVQTRLPQRPLQSIKISYPTVVIDSYMNFDDLINQVVTTNYFEFFEFT